MISLINSTPRVQMRLDSMRSRDKTFRDKSGIVLTASGHKGTPTGSARRSDTAESSSNYRSGADEKSGVAGREIASTRKKAPAGRSIKHPSETRPGSNGLQHATFSRTKGASARLRGGGARRSTVGTSGAGSRYSFYRSRPSLSDSSAGDSIG